MGSQSRKTKRSRRPANDELVRARAVLMWGIVSPKGNLLAETVSRTKGMAQDRAAEHERTATRGGNYESWGCLREDGYQLVRVRVQQVIT